MTIAEAKAAFAKFVAANSSLAAIIALVEFLFDKIDAAMEADQAELSAFRAKAETDRAKARSRMERLRHGGSRTFANVREQPPDASRVRARSSSSFLESKKEEGGGGDARARPIDENVSVEQIADIVERIVKETGHWPKGGWHRSATVEQIERRRRIGQLPSLIIDAVEVACKRDTSGQPFHSFTYFDAPIARAHAEADKQPTLPLGAPHVPRSNGPSRGGDAQREALQFGNDVIEQLRRTNIPGGS